MKRSYIASIQIEYVVVAESEGEAKELAVRAFREEGFYPFAEEFDLSSLSHLPGGYNHKDE